MRRVRIFLGLHLGCVIVGGAFAMGSPAYIVFAIPIMIAGMGCAIAALILSAIEMRKSKARLESRIGELEAEVEALKRKRGA